MSSTQRNPVSRRITRSSNKFMNNNKRQPFSEISNFNLIPPPTTLSKLPSSDDSKSETSVGSSDFNTTVHQTPITTRRRATLLPASSSTTPGSSCGELVLYNRLQNAKKCNSEAAPVPLITSRFHEKEMDNGKAVFKPFSSLPPKMTKENGKAIADPFGFRSPKTKEDKAKEVVSVSRDKKKNGIDEPLMSASPRNNKKNKAKAGSHEMFLSVKAAVEEKFGAFARNCSSFDKIKGKMKADASAFSCPPLPKIRTNRIELAGAGVIEPFGSWTDPNPKQKKKRCGEQEAAFEDSLPQDFISYWQEHYKKVDEFELTEEEVLYGDDSD